MLSKIPAKASEAFHKILIAKNQTGANRMIVQLLSLLTTVVKQLNQGCCRNMGVICFGCLLVTFGQAKVTKNQLAKQAIHLTRQSLIANLYPECIL
jgi:hypothetical protein